MQVKVFLPGMEENRIGVLGGIPQFHTNSIQAILCSVLHVCSDLVEHTESISTISTIRISFEIACNK